MYCSHCGKKVNDNMLFCPFCGEPIVIPEQDAPVEIETAADSAPVEEPEIIEEAAKEPEIIEIPEPEAPRQTPKPPREMGEAEAELLDWESSRREYASDDVWSDRGERAASAFAPLSLEAEEPAETLDWREEIARKKEEAAPQKKAPDISEGDVPRLDGVAPKLESDIEGAKPQREKPRKAASTLVPPKVMDPNDIFMDGSDKDDYDEFDAPSGKNLKEEEYVFEDADEGSFFMRHIRGLVGLALLVILLLMFVIFAFSRAGQQSRARVNLAWSTEAYSQLGYESYQAQQFEQAGLYYERALQRDPDNYSYASSAAMAYVEAKNTEKAAAMLKRCAEISPMLLEPYIYLLNLYPDAAQRPWDITQLLQQGYERTGDIRLNVTG